MSLLEWIWNPNDWPSWMSSPVCKLYGWPQAWQLRSCLGSDHRREKVVACLLAAATDLRADAAMLVMSSMLLALLSRSEARRRTGFEHRAKDAQPRCGLPRRDTAGGLTHVGAVEAESNDVDHFLHVVFTHTRVGARRATGRTIETFVDTAEERVAIHVRRLRMQLDDFLKGQHPPPSGPAYVPWP
jgi:hypothetical protein